ncbi:MAG: hypothetical protein HY670_05420 [Chloroflexi bacterium]|nr:hypothetical protein [Chloroflexota bacterium]
MTRHSPELWAAFLAILLITLAYFLVIERLGAVPASSSLSGHLLGAVGFAFMLVTETLYSVRKRARYAAHWGKMAIWLRFHIFTGLVGPYMVLLHTAWKFNGLAGVATLLTVVIVASGFVGRYIYTAVPRTVDGIEVDSATLESQIAAARVKLQDWLAANPEVSRSVSPGILVLPQVLHSTWLPIFGRMFLEWGYRWRWWRLKRLMKGIARDRLRELDKLLSRRRELHYQIGALVLVRRVLALWHAVHVPLGIALFTVAFVHAAVAIYYVTLAR